VFSVNQISERNHSIRLSLTDLMRRFPLEDNSNIKDLLQMSEKPDNF